MELANIEKLLEKYLNAETSLVEEQILQEYFCSGNVAAHLQEYEIMFSYFTSSKEETFTKAIQLEPVKKSNKNWKWLSVAASVLFLCSTYIGIQIQEKRLREKQFAQIKQALEIVSVNLNKGNDALFAVSKNINKGQDAMGQLYTYEKSVNKVLNTIKY